jgi:hypothetical protein
MSMTQELGSWVLSSEKTGTANNNKSAEDERQEMSTTINYTNDVSVLAGLVSNLNCSDEIKLQLQQQNSPIQ